jgi:hypothetical protein
MQAADVIARLVELEQAALKCDRSTIHKMLLEVEEGVLQLEQLTLETLRENATLRDRLAGCERYSLIERTLAGDAGYARVTHQH